MVISLEKELDANPTVPAKINPAAMALDFKVFSLNIINPPIYCDDYTL
jgi:hypothetical protein